MTLCVGGGGELMYCHMNQIICHTWVQLAALSNVIQLTIIGSGIMIIQPKFYIKAAGLKITLSIYLHADQLITIFTESITVFFFFYSSTCRVVFRSHSSRSRSTSVRVGSLLCTVHRPGGCTERRTLSRHHTVGSHRQTRERWRRDGACLNCDPDKGLKKL